MNRCKVLIAICCLAWSFCLIGCASIVSGTTQQLSFQSNPDGALVTVNGRELGKTPVSTTVKRNHSVPLTFSKPGYKTISMEMTSGINGWFWGNIFIGWLYGSTTDGVSGAVHKYSPDQYMVTMSPDGTGAEETHTALTDKQKAKDFIVISYKQLIPEIKRGEGQYLDSLIATLKIPTEQKKEAVVKIKALSEAYSNIPEFADRVIDLYMK
jgi:hypothetical protein